MSAYMKKPNKFDELSRDELLRRCLEQEDELEKWRPKPAKFRLGQLVVCTEKVPYIQKGQPFYFFTVLSVEQRNNMWHYGFTTKPAYPGTTNSGFQTFPEKMLRLPTQQELTGMDLPTLQPQVSIAESLSQSHGLGGQVPPPGGISAVIGPGNGPLATPAAFDDF